MTGCHVCAGTRVETVLDLGCGAGNFSLKLAPLFALEKVTLVDLSANMLDRAMERLGGRGVELRAVQCDVRDLDLEPDSQDIIVAAAGAAEGIGLPHGSSGTRRTSSRSSAA